MVFFSFKKLEVTENQNEPEDDTDPEQLECEEMNQIIYKLRTKKYNKFTKRFQSRLHKTIKPACISNPQPTPEPHNIDTTHELLEPAPQKKQKTDETLEEIQAKKDYDMRIHNDLYTIIEFLVDKYEINEMEMSRIGVLVDRYNWKSTYYRGAFDNTNLREKIIRRIYPSTLDDVLYYCLVQLLFIFHNCKVNLFIKSIFLGYNE